MSHDDPPMTSLERRIRQAERDLFAEVGVTVDECFVDLPQTGRRARVLSVGSGPALVMLHGVSLSAAAWAPLFPRLRDVRCLAVDLPGHGLSDRVKYRRGHVRDHTIRLIDDIFDALGLDHAPVVGHSLGGMFALWHMAAGSERISGLVAVGVPAVALPGTRVRMPLSALTVPGLGAAILRSRSPRSVHRRLLSQGLGPAEVAAAPEALLEALRWAARRPENAATVASLMHAIDHFRRGRPESVLTPAEFAAITAPTVFILGSDDPYLSPADAHPSIERMPAATLHELPAGHAPFLVDPERVADLTVSAINSWPAVVATPR